jgi:CTP:molybdopterin cytidylyltransferase MocA
VTIAGLVLAAGQGSRFGQPKAPFTYRGLRLVDRAVETVRSAGLDPAVVVLGAWIGDVPNATIVVNEQWTSGMGSSLRTGLRALSTDKAIDAALVLLVDQPGISAQAITRIVDSGAHLAQASYEGRPGHPVLIGREHWQALIDSASGDVGARDYLKSSRDLVRVEVGDISDDTDLDTHPEE